MVEERDGVKTLVLTWTNHGALKLVTHHTSLITLPFSFTRELALMFQYYVRYEIRLFTPSINQDYCIVWGVVIIRLSFDIPGILILHPYTPESRQANHLIVGAGGSDTIEYLAAFP